MVSLDDMVHRCPEVVARETPTGAILVDLADGDCFEVNRVGALFWASIESPRRLGEVCEALGSRFDVGRDILDRDLLKLVEELLRADLVEVKASAPGPIAP
jgi:hypothetical protein